MGVDGGDPIEVIDGQLMDVSIGEAHHEYAMKNATWDYIHGDTLAWWAADAESAYGADSHRVAGTLSSAELDTWQDSGEFPPQTYGAHYWQVDADLPATMTAILETGDAESWWLGLATVGDGQHQQSVGLSDDQGLIYLLIEDMMAMEEAWLVVTAVEGSENTGESFPYRISLEEGDQRPSDLDGGEAVAGGCACGTSAPLPGRGAWGFLGLVLVGVLTRRSDRDYTLK
jgi:hypothetical protein